MLVFHASFNEITFEDDRYLRDLDRAIRKLMREAIRDWLIAVLSAVKSANKPRGDPYTIGDSFPIVTGEAKGSLIPLGRAIKYPVPVRPKPGRPNRIAIGMQKGRYLYSREGHGPVWVHDTYFFNFQTDVAHYKQNEYISRMTDTKNLLSQTPWHTLEAGKTAFIKTMSHLKERVPRINNYAKIKAGAITG